MRPEHLLADMSADDAADTQLVRGTAPPGGVLRCDRASVQRFFGHITRTAGPDEAQEAVSSARRIVPILSCPKCGTSRPADVSGCFGCKLINSWGPGVGVEIMPRIANRLLTRDVRRGAPGYAGASAHGAATAPVGTARLSAQRNTTRGTGTRGLSCRRAAAGNHKSRHRFGPSPTLGRCRAILSPLLPVAGATRSVSRRHQRGVFLIGG